MNLSTEGEYWLDNIRSSTTLLPPAPANSVARESTSFSSNRHTLQQLSSFSQRPAQQQTRASSWDDCLFEAFHDHSLGSRSKDRLTVGMETGCTKNESLKEHLTAAKGSFASPKSAMKRNLRRSSSFESLSIRNPTMSPRRKMPVPVHARLSPASASPRQRRGQQQQRPVLEHGEIDWRRSGFGDDPPGTNFDDCAAYGGFGGDDADNSTQNTPTSSSHSYTASTATNTVSPSSRTTTMTITPQHRKRSTVTTTRSGHYSSSPISPSTSATSPNAITPLRRGGRVTRSRSRRMNPVLEGVASSPRRETYSNDSFDEDQPVPDEFSSEDDEAVFAKVDFRQIEQLFLFPFPEPEGDALPQVIPPSSPTSPSRRVGVKRSNSHRRPPSQRQSSGCASEKTMDRRRKSNEPLPLTLPPSASSQLVSDPARIPYHRSVAKRLKDREEEERSKLMSQIRNRSALPTAVARPPTPPKQRRISAFPPTSPGHRSRRRTSTVTRVGSIGSGTISSFDSTSSASRSKHSGYVGASTRGGGSTSSGAPTSPSVAINGRGVASHGNTQSALYGSESPTRNNRGGSRNGMVVQRRNSHDSDFCDSRTDIFGTNLDQLSAFDDSFTELITWTRFRK